MTILTILIIWLILGVGLALALAVHLRNMNRINYRLGLDEEAAQWTELWDRQVRHLPEKDRIEIRNMVNIGVFNARTWPTATYDGQGQPVKPSLVEVKG